MLKALILIIIGSLDQFEPCVKGLDIIGLSAVEVFLVGSEFFVDIERLDDVWADEDDDRVFVIERVILREGRTDEGETT